MLQLRNITYTINDNRIIIGNAIIRYWHSSNQLLGRPSTTTEEWKKIKKMKGIPMNSNAYGALTDLPDYTFLDGRPTPPLVGQLRRAKKQRKLTEKILELTAEVDFAVARSNRLNQEAEKEKQNILSQKLKPKEKLIKLKLSEQ